MGWGELSLWIFVVWGLSVATFSESALVLCHAQEGEKYNAKKLLCMSLSWGFQGKKLSCREVSG